MATRSIAGGVPEPEELIGRQHTIEFIWEQLAANNVLLVAPRRFGKTGVMGHLLKRPRSGYLPIYLDTKTNEYGFLLNVIRDWWQRFHRTLRVKGK